MHSPTCLNCAAPLTGKFCQNCGQKADTHRLSMKHFILHDAVHGIWHLERGILFSLKSILLKPGKASKEYIAGKRAGHFNIITLLLILSGVLLYVGGKQANASPLKVSLSQLDLTETVRHHAKFILLSVIPVLALSSRMVYRRLNYNYTEHLLICCYYMINVIIFFIIAGLIDWAAPAAWDNVISGIKFASVFVFLMMTLWQSFGPAYSLIGWLWRFLLLLIVILLLLLLVLLVAGAVVSFFKEELHL